MQIMPDTADYIARKSGGTRFERADLATPQINIAYGTWYLRYLLDKYKGNTILTLAAYNAGEGKVDEWRANAAARGEKFRVADHIPFKETRDYVHRVLERARGLPQEVRATNSGSRSRRGITPRDRRVVGGINTSAPTFAPGSTFAGYRIEAEAGRGGMGIVYRATQVALGRPVALKLIAANFAGDRSFRERFKREWETAASIDHPNVIPVYEAGEAEEHLFIAMRYVEGLDLANLLAREPELAPERAVRIIAQVAVGARRRARPRPRPPRRQARQRPDRRRGARLPHRLRPHQARLPGRPDQDRPVRRQRRLRRPGADPRRGDGRPHRRLLARLRPLPDPHQAPPYDKPADVAKMYAHVSEPPPVVSEARLDGSTAFDAVVAKAMAKEPDDRYQSAGDLARAAQAALTGGSRPLNIRQHKKPRSARNPIVKGSDPSGGEVSRRTKVAIGVALPACSWPGWPRRGLRRAA